MRSFFAPTGVYNTELFLICRKGTIINFFQKGDHIGKIVLLIVVHSHMATVGAQVGAAVRQ
jgi:hypothetical protein